MNFLVTNDDGIYSKGLRILVQEAAKYGQVWVVAPSRQMSACSQSISIRSRMQLMEVDLFPSAEKAWSLDGTPADCVKVALHLLLSSRPDFIFSGINDGYNIAFDVRYSATVGAAMEGRMAGIPSAAFSCQRDSIPEGISNMLSSAFSHILSAPLRSNEIWNVNFPDCPESLCRGIKSPTVAAPMQLFEETYRLLQIEGKSFVEEIGLPKKNICAGQGTDISALLDNYISCGLLSCPEIR